MQVIVPVGMGSIEPRDCREVGLGVELSSESAEVERSDATVFINPLPIDVGPGTQKHPSLQSAQAQLCGFVG